MFLNDQEFLQRPRGDVSLAQELLLCRRESERTLDRLLVVLMCPEEGIAFTEKSIAGKVGRDVVEKAFGRPLWLTSG